MGAISYILLPTFSLQLYFSRILFLLSLVLRNFPSSQLGHPMTLKACNVFGTKQCLGSVFACILLFDRNSSHKSIKSSNNACNDLSWPTKQEVLA